jgi:hypothetical protein
MRAPYSKKDADRSRTLHQASGCVEIMLAEVMMTSNAVAGALVLCRDEVTYSPAQRLRDNLKLEVAYKRLARSVA